VTTYRRGKVYAQETGYQIRILTPKQIAFNLPCPFVLQTGTRVIALFNEEFKNVSSGANSSFYVGIVAEPPKKTNNYR